MTVQVEKAQFYQASYCGMVGDHLYSETSGYQKRKLLPHEFSFNSVVRRNAAIKCSDGGGKGILYLVDGILGK